jgi:DNA primase
VKECSAIMDITEQTLLNELNRVRRKNFDKKLKEKSREEQAPETVDPHIFQPEKQVDLDFLSSEYQEKDVIRLLMNFGNREITLEYTDEDGNEKKDDIDVASFIVSDLLNDEIPFGNNLYQRIFDEVNTEINNGNLTDEQFFLSHNDNEISALATTLLTSKYELNDWARVKIHVNSEEDKLKVAVEHAILSMKLRWLERKFDETIKALQNATEDFDADILLTTQKKLLNKKMAISAKLGRIVLR